MGVPELKPEDQVEVNEETRWAQMRAGRTAVKSERGGQAGRAGQTDGTSRVRSTEVGTCGGTARSRGGNRPENRCEKRRRWEAEREEDSPQSIPDCAATTSADPRRGSGPGSHSP